MRGIGLARTSAIGPVICHRPGHQHSKLLPRYLSKPHSQPAHAAVDAVKRSGLGWIDELAARLGHGRSVSAQALRKNRIGRNLGSDLSEGRVSVLLYVLYGKIP